MSARIDEYHESVDKPWTTKEVEKWQFVLGPTMPLRRSLATTRALEDAERKRDEFKVASQEKAGWLLDALARAEKAERERDRLAVDAMTALIAADICTPERGYVEEPVCLTMDIGKLARERDELVAALNAVLLSWDASDDGMVHVDAIDAARAALAKAKETKP